ncbi:MAG: excinuclease ABC subunit UvrC [Chlamydiales bacterium]|nr:excinuclease ABC subunit UvrC [Chlamydiales bacterium]
MRFDVTQLEQFPKETGVYLMKDASGKVIYVGKAKQLRVRLKQYFAKGRDERAMIPHLVAQIAHIDTLLVPTEKEALMLENTLIKKHQPKFNAVLKDDKTFISLMINHDHKWPMVRLIRYKGRPKEKALYFGPYTSAHAARQTFELITRLFPLRQCSDEELKRRTRPCLLYSIKRCIAPCVGLCTKPEYDEFVDGAIKFLKGQDKEVLKELYREMERASENLEFEKAAALLQTIRQIEHVTEHEGLVSKASRRDCDAIGLFCHGDESILMQLFFREGKLIGSEHYSFFRVAQKESEILETFIMQHYRQSSAPPPELLLPIELPEAALLEEILFEAHQKKIELVVPKKGDKRELVHLAEKNAKATFEQEKNQQELQEKLLLDLQESCKLNRYPKRIDCFDTSNIAGSDLVAAVISFSEGKRDRAKTRLYRIRGIEKSDDYGALHQALSRHLQKAKDADDLPDLVLIDGGKGQLNVALDVFKELDIASVDVISIAKEAGRHDQGLSQERLFIPNQKEPVQLSIRSPLLFLLQKIRDETHEKAIGYHRKRRQKRTLSSSLEEIPGIGKVKKTRLLRHFGSLKRILEASEEELKEVKGINRRDIERLKSSH